MTDNKILEELLGQEKRKVAELKQIRIELEKIRKSIFKLAMGQSLNSSEMNCLDPATVTLYKDDKAFLEGIKDDRD